jgi:transposase InsO family protein
VLDDFSRFIVAWKLCATMKAQDVMALDLALAASGLDHMTVVHRPRLLSDNGSSYVASDLADWLDGQAEHRACPRSALPSADPGQNRALASDAQEPHPGDPKTAAFKTLGLN